MIIFSRIKWKNLLSTGNSFTEVCLNDTPNTLIIGENGSGKSTILDALCFALFGKAFRNINKGNLVNSVNQKGLVTEIEFTISNKSYKVIRGIKPNIFEIWCDGICLNQDSSTKDYQEHLEKFILKMTYKSFTQIVILGSASFKPFMQLTPAERRIIIEDLLDIQIFSVMNTIVKQRFLTNKEAIERNRIESFGKTEKLQFVQKTLHSLKENNELKLQQLERQYAEYNTNRNLLSEHLLKLSDEETSLLQKTEPLTVLRNKFNKALNLKAKLTLNSDRCDKSIEFYHVNDTCPTCKQSLDSTFIKTELSKLNAKRVEYSNAVSDITSKVDVILKEIDALEKFVAQSHGLSIEIAKKKTEISTLQTQMKSIKETIDQMKVSDKLTSENEEELLKMENDISVLEKEKHDLIDERTLIETSIQLLKDGGIKTRIIKQYLPIINKMINKYLQQMGFFVSFNIDENFNETIKSRYRDEFSYHNFSEGEKMRIDLAILYTWRYVAKMRNSINTNLLLFDEIFDGSLDANGTDEFLKIMWNLAGDTNVFVISHKQDMLVDKFKKVIRFQKSKNFSQLTV